MSRSRCPSNRPAGSCMPKTKWPICAENALARLCRKQIGLYVVKSDSRNNWLFAGSLRAGKRGAAIMSLIQSAKLNGHDPYAYLKDVLTRLPTQRNSMIAQLLPHRWTPATASA